MIPAIVKNLERGIILLNSMSDEEYSNSSTPPYYSSIGVHMRHILDVFQCVFSGLDEGQIDLSDRQRNEQAETKVSSGIDYFHRVIGQLKELENADLNKEVIVRDDLGLGMESARYTVAAALIQAHSHAIHHFASIGYIVSHLGINLPDRDFGYNPTTPRGDIMEK